MSEMDLPAWLREQLDERGWSMNELARRAHISGAQVSHVLNERSNAGADFCVAISRPLNTSPVFLLELAGIIPPQPKLNDPQVQELVRLFGQLTETEQSVVLQMMRGLQTAQAAQAQLKPQEEKPVPSGRRTPAAGTVSTFAALGKRVIEGEFWQMPGRLATWLTYPGGVPESRPVTLRLGAMAVTVPGSASAIYPMGLALALFWLMQRVVSGFNEVLIGRVSELPYSSWLGLALFAFFFVAMMMVLHLLLSAVVRAMHNEKRPIIRAFYNGSAAMLMLFLLMTAAWSVWKLTVLLTP